MDVPLALVFLHLGVRGIWEQYQGGCPSSLSLPPSRSTWDMGAVPRVDVPLALVFLHLGVRGIWEQYLGGCPSSLSLPPSRSTWDMGAVPGWMSL